MTVQRPDVLLRARQRVICVVLALLLCGREVSTLGGAYLPEETLRQAPAHAPATLPVRQEPSSRSPADSIDDGWGRASPRRLRQSNSSQGQSPKGDLGSTVAAGRRLTVVGARYSVKVIDNPDISNLVDVPESATNIEVRAGIYYREFQIIATSGLGSDHQQIMVKLVPYDMAATLSTCELITSYMDKPFNGKTNQAVPNQNTADFNKFQPTDGFFFPQAGKFRLCYFAGSTWEELSPAINVIGSEDLDDKIWCNKNLMDNDNCLGNDGASIAGCECKGKVEGYNWDSVNNKLTTLGLPNPAPAWKIMLADADKDCGGTTKPTPFANGISVVTNYEGYEIHNLGVRNGEVALKTYKVCYCVGFDKNNENGACYQDGPEDFPQKIGTLITLQFRSAHGSQKTLSVFPILRFSLLLECGVDINQPGGSPGGCVDTNVARYKIVEKKAENDLAYFETGNGCRFLPQVATTISGSITSGGQVGPTNCLGPVLCNDEPEALGPKFPEWYDIQIDASYENSVMIPKEYDLCYCDGNCLNSMSWFKAGQLRVNPIEVYFSVSETDSNDNLIPVVNTMYYLLMKGKVNPGDPDWGSWTSTGSQAREMKILSDPFAIVDKISCLTEAQPDTVSGHRLITPNTDYTDPSVTMHDGNGHVGQRYGNVYDQNGQVSPNIKLLQSGWYAVCYCDSNCNEMLNWAMYGRVLIAGPHLNQQWTRYVGVTFDIEVTGWNLAPQNRLRILDFSKELGDCGTQGSIQSDYVFGPSGTATMLQKISVPQTRIVTQGITYDSRGSLVTFERSHGLKDGDQFWLSGVSVLGALAQDQSYGDAVLKMYNRNHEVFVHCDNVTTGCYKILIPVKMEPAAFAGLDVDSADWRRSNTQYFSNIRANTASQEGRGYKVCWSETLTNDINYVGQAGTITVKDPIQMPAAALGLTSVMPSKCGGGACVGSELSPGSPVIVAFTTGDLARYAQAEGPMQLVIVFQLARYPSDNGLTTAQGNSPYIEAVQPIHYDLSELGPDEDNNELGEETQALCGKIFLEMWSEDPNGFPMPKGCYYDEDSVDPDVTLRQIHIIFSPRNHLKKQTRYMLVLNAKIDGELKGDWPPDGAVFIWSMDDINTNRFGVVERGRGYPTPDSRTPPRDSLGNLLLNTNPDGQFDPASGLIVQNRDMIPHPTYADRQVELTSYCRAYDDRFPTSTPTVANQCKPCKNEYDCGNGNLLQGIAPVGQWCISPMDTLCPEAGGSPTGYPMFEVALQAKPGRSILRSAVLRLFLQPLTAWDLYGSGGGGAACYTKMAFCVGPNGGECRNPICEAEMVVGGQVIGPPAYPVNIMKITLPSVMADITSTMRHTIAIGGAPLPPGGFYPTELIAELMKEGQTAPDYWSIRPNNNNLPAGSAKLFKTPTVMSASIVTNLGDGNDKPFKQDTDNILYIRVVVGANLFARIGEGIQMEFRLPAGYTCTIAQAGLEVPTLGVVGDSVPSYQGRLGGNLVYENEWSRKDTPYHACVMSFKIFMMYYAYSAVFVAVQVNNPQTPLKADDPTNYWRLSITGNYGDTITADLFTFEPPTGLTGYGANVPALGKLSEIVIAPGDFGLGKKNMMEIFFKTEQQVGTTTDVQAEIWVDAPSGFDFGRYCTAFQLSDSYYIPEPTEKTYELPAGALIECYGATTDATQLTYNRAKITTTGRLLSARKYGFKLQVTNTANYIRSQLDGWTLWTYRKSSQDGVDGAYFTGRMNAQLSCASPEVATGSESLCRDLSWGSYQTSVPAGGFVVSVADLRPTTAGMLPSDITFLPIVVQLPMQKAVRIYAPAGYQWDFIQTEFRYRAPNPGVPANQIIQGAEQDLPISGVPASPVSEPRNLLTIDYMQAEWIPGVKYGFVAKIRIPMLPPTASANYFTIEFGYNEPEQAGRLEAGVYYAPLVQRIINGGISFTSSVKAEAAEISFTMRLISAIPRGGGLFITGPPNFVFAAKCQPKPYRPEFPELPYDSTCLFESNAATGAAEISIIAGPSGIPAQFYRFVLEGSNPPQKVLTANAGTWKYYSYTVISEKTALDYHTEVPGYAVNDKMFNAALVAPPKVSGCWFQSAEEAIQFPNAPKYNCNFTDWQFYPPQGQRDDRPGSKSALIFLMQLATSAANNQILTVRAPEGYIFNTECKVETDSSKIFDATNTDGQVPCGPTYGDPPQQICYAQSYATWPSITVASNCHGDANVARITLTCGNQPFCLGAFSRYLFRLEVLQNPMATPVPNDFMLEYNNEASAIFPGVPIWAFIDGTILPTTTAASLRDRATVNNVTVYLRPTNDVPNGGHILIEAPAGFILDTHCWASVEIHPDEAINASTYPAGSVRNNVLKYSEFLQGDFDCEGDVTMSSRARLHFRVNDKYLKANILYLFVFEVTNPQVTTQYEDLWTFTSYQDSTPNLILDSANVPGFPVNKAVESFAWMTPNSVNALALQILEFNMSFPIDVSIGDMVEIIAPVTYYFSERGDAQCPSYQYLDGNLRKTIPICGANTISWLLEEEEVPAGTAVRFLVRVQNPPRTPDLNLFQLRQVAPTGKRKSSRMIPGYLIIPELASVVVTQIAPTISCRSLVPIITQLNCTATGSRGAFTISFFPTAAANLVQIRAHVSGNSFDFTSATLPIVQGTTDPGVTNAAAYLHSQTATAITANLDVRPGTRVTIIVEGAVHPTVPGIAQISITTYQGIPSTHYRVDEKLNLATHRIQDYINRRYSNVNPFYFGTTAATVTFELEPYMALAVHDVLRITRPPGYMMKDQSLQVSRDLRVSEHGLDFMRRWSSQFENPEDYYMVISRYVAAETRILFSFSADLPSVPQSSPYWFFRSYRVEPYRDLDGEILDGSAVPYPWIGRDITETGTNDGAFTGFILVGQVPFNVNPSLRTPGAEISLTVAFQLAAPVVAVTQVRVELFGPTGYVFKDNCFATVPPTFSKCTGYRNTATLVSTVNNLAGSTISVVLTVTNPGQTPATNTWQLSIYRDTSKQEEYWSLVSGYGIENMPVTYRGNNQLGVLDTAFFQFSPLSDSNSEVLHIQVIPPPNQGYRLLCGSEISSGGQTGYAEVKVLGFSSLQRCEVEGPDTPLTLTFRNGTLSAEKAYTFGVGVLNPGGKPDPNLNYWGVLLKDYQPLTFDGNLRVQGEDLKSVPLRAGQMGWATSAPNVMNTLSLQLRVLHTIFAGSITRIVIGAPQYVRFIEDPAAVTTNPAMPLFTGKPTEISNPPEIAGTVGPLLMLNLDPNSDINENMYTIRFDCSNPGQTPWDNTWSLLVMKNIELEYSHYKVGFVPGQVTPIDINAVSATNTNSARRTRSGDSTFTSLLRLVLIAMIVPIHRQAL